MRLAPSLTVHSVLHNSDMARTTLFLGGISKQFFSLINNVIH